MTIQLAGCVLTDIQGRILLIHRHTADYDHWEIPGGKVEPNETNQQAAIRELQEELGVTVVAEHEIGRAIFDDNARQFEYTWWLASTNETPVLQETDLFSEYDYFDLNHLNDGELQLSEGVKALLTLVKSQPGIV